VKCMRSVRFPTQQFDDLESSRDCAGSRDTSSVHLVRKHLEHIGLDGDIAQYNEISGLSGGKNVSYDNV
jgi:elongation factor 3